jgi:ADP-heptose:LPS heptosyltransferase
MSHLRRWPKEYFAHVIKHLIKKYDVLIVLIGGKGDVSYTNGFFQQFFETGNIINLCGKLSISQLIGLFSRSCFLTTNDSGPLHIATTMGLPTISFFGPETPYLYGPQGKKHHVFYSDIFCSPCLNIFNSKLADCDDNVCLKQIDPESVDLREYKFWGNEPPSTMAQRIFCSCHKTPDQEV